MSNKPKPQSVILRDPGREDALWKRLENVLQKISDCVPFDVATVKSSADLTAAIASLDPACTLWVDLQWAEAAGVQYVEEWKGKPFVLVRGDDSVLAAGSSWAQCPSCVNLSSLPAADLPRLVQVGLAQERFPGVAPLAEKSSEIFFEKLQSLNDLGAKTDRLLNVLERKFPSLQPQFFNLRQLCYAAVHHGFEASAEAAQLCAVVDFQVSVTEKRVVFGTRFSAEPGTFEQWLTEMRSGENHFWQNMRMSADALVLTELTELKQVELKAIVSAEGSFHQGLTNTVFAKSVPNFDSDSLARDEQKSSRFQSLSSLGSVASKEGEGDEGADEEGDGEPSEAAQLNFRLKSDMLERERNNLQGMVKKKTHLIANLNKDLNRAQKELVIAQNNAAKEVHKARMEAEKAKNEAREATDRMRILDRKLKEAQGAGTSESDDKTPKRDFEKEFKQADYARRTAEEKQAELSGKLAHMEEIISKARKEIGELSAENNELKAKVYKLEQAASLAAKAAQEKKDTPTQANPAESVLAEKLKESQKALGEARSKGDELTKEVKALKIKLDTMEKNKTAAAATSGKDAKTVDKAVEAAKQQKAELQKKYDALAEQLKKKQEEWAKAELALKKKIEELSAAAAAAAKAAPGGKAA